VNAVKLHRSRGSSAQASRGKELVGLALVALLSCYLRRNPTDPPDHNNNGYQFWLTKLNNFNGDFQKAEIVKAFICRVNIARALVVRELPFTLQHPGGP
jgi:hypothetical protein